MDLQDLCPQPLPAPPIYIPCCNHCHATAPMPSPTLEIKIFGIRTDLRNNIKMPFVIRKEGASKRKLDFSFIDGGIRVQKGVQHLFGSFWACFGQFWPILPPPRLLGPS